MNIYRKKRAPDKGYGRIYQNLYLCLISILATVAFPNAVASEEIEYTNIVEFSGSDVDYRRTPSLHHVYWYAFVLQHVISKFEFATEGPIKSRGAPGVALFDYDRDGDTDIYVTNGPGTPNSLYSNQSVESNSLHFIDVAKSAGVAATLMDSTGVCYGDTDNDGDYDLYVLGAGFKNRLYINNADGTFTYKRPANDAGIRVSYSASCSMGDVNGDALLDIVVANTQRSWMDPHEPTEPNQLLINKGKNEFKDYSKESGILQVVEFPDEQFLVPGLTWAISLVDYDLDADVDIIMADAQSNFPVEGLNGVKGRIRVLKNDGHGHFKDVTVESGLDINGNWNGLSFGDLNSDGYMDFFATNTGDYTKAEFFPYELGELASRPFFGLPGLPFATLDIDYSDATVFGWGTVMADYDNDGDTDVVYAGGADGGPMVDASNPGVILENDGNGYLTVNTAPLADLKYTRRNVQGLAKGDLNKDGFIDLVSVANFDIPESVPLFNYSVEWGSVFDDKAYFVPTFTPVGPKTFYWNGYLFDYGTLSIDINSANNKNGAVAIDLLGTAGVLQGSLSNRDGIGAIVSFTPDGGRTTMQPITAGESYASQSELTAHFGLGEARKGTVEVLWPGGTRNRFYGLKEGERIVLPEIPCSYTDDWSHTGEYVKCVRDSLQELVAEGLVDRRAKLNILRSAIKAYRSFRRTG